MPDVVATVGIPGDSERGEICHRGAAGQDSAGAFRVPHHLVDPADHLLLDPRRHVIDSPDIGVEDGSQKISQRAHHGAAAHVPGPETRVVGVQIVGQDIRLELVVHLGRGRRFGRRWRFQAFETSCRNGIPNGAFSGGLYVVQCIVDHAMGQVAHFIPVLRVQGFVVCLYSSVWLVFHSDGLVPVNMLNRV